MWKFFISVFVLVLISCKSEQKKDEVKLTEIKNKRAAVVNETYIDKRHEGRTFLDISELINYRNKTETISVKNTFSKPFDKVDFDKVIAYDYLGSEEPDPSIFNEKGGFNNVVLKQKALSEKQVISIINTLSSKKTYGAPTAACFNPHLAFVFYKNNKSVFVVDICLGCNYLTSTEEIPAMYQHVVNKGKEDEYYIDRGFSKKGKSKLIALCKDLDFFYGKK